MGDSGDEWELDLTDGLPGNWGCEQLSDFQFSFAPDDADVAALLKVSALLIDDTAAALRLGHPTELNTPPAERAASEALHQMEAHKQDVLRTKRGSWSMADEIELGRVRALLSTGRISQYRPYLVRAFRWKGAQTQLIVDLCGGYIRSWVDSGKSGRQPKPERAAAIVFLPTAPVGSFARWTEESLGESR